MTVWRRTIGAVVVACAALALAGCDRAPNRHEATLANVCQFKSSLPRGFCDCIVDSARRDLVPAAQELLVLAWVNPRAVLTRTAEGLITGDTQDALHRFLEPAAVACSHAMT